MAYQQSTSYNNKINNIHFSTARAGGGNMHSLTANRVYRNSCSDEPMAGLLFLMYTQERDSVKNEKHL
jgi:hypothetical protein